MITYKGYIIKTDAASPRTYLVAKEGRGGSIPKELIGSYTTKEVAIRFIDLYLEGKDKRGK